MKLILIFFSLSSTYAQDFTLTRNDGKVFYCKEAGPGVQPVSFNICECHNLNGQFYGQVYGPRTLDACKTLVGTWTPRLSKCRNVQGSMTALSCDCKDYNGNFHGQVTGENAAADCKSLVGSHYTPRLENCEIR